MNHWLLLRNNVTRGSHKPRWNVNSHKIKRVSGWGKIPPRIVPVPHSNGDGRERCVFVEVYFPVLSVCVCVFVALGIGELGTNWIFVICFSIHTICVVVLHILS